MKTTSFLSSLTLGMLLIPTAFAKPAAVNLKDCAQVANTTTPFILILKQDDDLNNGIAQCVQAAKLKGALVSGLGQVHNPTLAYFTSNPKDKPITTTFKGYYELAAMNGNVSNVGNRYYTHIHAVLADKEFHGIAGHVDNSKVGLTVEVSIVPLQQQLKRALDEKTGFGPITP